MYICNVRKRCSRDAKALSSLGTLRSTTRSDRDSQVRILKGALLNKKKNNNFLKKFKFFKKITYLYIEIRKRTKNNKVMMSINKHMNIWSNSFKGYCGNSYALAGTDVRFDERPSITEVEYVVRD